jgi:hypothetical protein
MQSRLYLSHDMHIYLDESGTFVIPKAASPTISAMGALAVPNCFQRAIWKRYRRIRVGLPTQNGEVKGRLLNEKQISGIVEMLIDTPVLFNIDVIDTGMQSAVAVEKHRDGQADKLLASVGPAHRPLMIAEMQQLAQRLRQTSLQLYIETQLIFNVVMKILQNSMIFYSQTLPEELGSFDWVFDSKDSNKITNWEQWWKTMIAPMFQSMAIRQHMGKLEDGDYTYFDRTFEMDTPEWFKEATGETESRCTDLGNILRNFAFDPGINYGLELVDVLTNATCRALRGNLGEEGWQYISKLIPKLRDKHRVQMVSFTEPDAGAKIPYTETIRKFDRYGRRLLIDQSHRVKR